MTVFFVGGELDGLRLTTPGEVGITTDTTYFDSRFARQAIYTGHGQPMIAALPGVGNELWISFHCAFRGTTTGIDQWVKLRSPSGDMLLAADTYAASGAGGIFFAVNTGRDASVDVSFAERIVAPVERYRVDIHLVLSAAGAVTVYVDGLLEDSIGVDLSLWGNEDLELHLLNKAYGSSSSFARAYFSEIIAADQDTRNMRVNASSPVAVGTYNDWAGDHNTVNHAALDDLTLLTSDTAGQRQTFTLAQLPAEALEMDTVAVALSGRMQNILGAPDNIQPLLRRGTIDHSGLAIPGLQVGLNGRQVIFENDPFTTLPWATLDVAGTEYGFESAV